MGIMAVATCSWGPLEGVLGFSMRVVKTLKPEPWLLGLTWLLGGACAPAGMRHTAPFATPSHLSRAVAGLAHLAGSTGALGGSGGLQRATSVQVRSRRLCRASGC
jgi:hypothetical protein